MKRVRIFTMLSMSILFLCLSGRSFASVDATSPSGGEESAQMVSILVEGNTLSASMSGLDYAWFLDGEQVSSSQLVKADKSGTYVLQASDAEGMMGRDSMEVLISEKGDDDDAGMSMHVGPNPNSGKVKLHLKAEHGGKIAAEIRDLQGKSVWEMKGKKVGSNFEKHVDLNYLDSGTYVVVCEFEGRTLTKHLSMD